MPTFRSAPDLVMHYEVDDFCDPWRDKQTILMLHGNAESSAAWDGWVPHLARRYRVVRPDIRGFGPSPPRPRAYPFPPDVGCHAFVPFIDILAINRLHLVG